MKIEIKRKQLQKATLIFFTLLLVIFLSGCEASTSQFSPSPTLGPTFTPSFTPAPTSESTPTIPTTPTPAVKGEQVQEALVTRVIDGDTIQIEGGKKVRYIGIDTPETVDPRKPVQCFGYEASNKNKELVGGKKVRLEKDVSETDKYGRLLRYVWVGDILVNDYLVRQGYAQSYTYPPDVKYQNQFLEAQKEARKNNRGLWKACDYFGQPLSTPTVIPTSVLPSQPTPTTYTPPQQTGGCVIKGNISYKTGEKIYHIPGCPNYNSTVIDESKGERWFCSEAEAQAAGWRKALNCP